MLLLVPASTITEILPQVVHTVYEPTWDIIVTQSPQRTLAITFGVVTSTGICHFFYFQFPKTPQYFKEFNDWGSSFSSSIHRK